MLIDKMLSVDLNKYSFGDTKKGINLCFFNDDR